MSNQEWARCAPWLQKALDHAGQGRSLDEIRGLVERGHAGFVPGSRSAAVVEVVKSFHVWLAGGDMEELLKMEEAARGWAVANDCRQMTLRGRQGWTRVLRGRGYEPETLLVKGL